MGCRAIQFFLLCTPTFYILLQHSSSNWVYMRVTFLSSCWWRPGRGVNYLFRCQPASLPGILVPVCNPVFHTYRYFPSSCCSNPTTGIICGLPSFLMLVLFMLLGAVERRDLPVPAPTGFRSRNLVLGRFRGLGRICAGTVHPLVRFCTGHVLYPLSSE
jgi:hypothetical protein